MNIEEFANRAFDIVLEKYARTGEFPAASQEPGREEIVMVNIGAIANERGYFAHIKRHPDKAPELEQFQELAVLLAEQMGGTLEEARRQQRTAGRLITPAMAALYDVRK